MSLGTRKVIVLVLVGVLFLIANIWLVANWLEEKGVIEWAKHIRSDYLTGTAITIIIVLLILLVKPGGGRGLVRRCPVCEHTRLGGGNYCGECGSRV